jgi:hypothetical protein
MSLDVTELYAAPALATALEVAAVRESVDAVSTRLDDVDLRVAALEDGTENEVDGSTFAELASGPISSRDVPAPHLPTAGATDEPVATPISPPPVPSSAAVRDANQAERLAPASRIIVQLTDAQFERLVSPSPAHGDTPEYQTKRDVTHRESSQSRTRGTKGSRRLG